MTLDEIDKAGYAHFMLKEIMEQPESVRNSMRGRILLDEGTAKLGDLRVLPTVLQNQKDYYFGMRNFMACRFSW